MPTPSGAIRFATLLLALSAAACGGSSGNGNNNQPANHAPVSVTATLVTAGDTASAPATPAVIDPDAGDVHTFTILVQPGRGLASVAGNRLVYVPDPAFAGTDTFTFRATDGGGLSVDGTASVTVTPVNHPPTASGGAVAVHAGTTQTRVPWVDDLDPWDVHTIELVSALTTVTVSVTPGGAGWTFSPDAVTSDSLSYTYRIFDPSGASTLGLGRARVYDDTALAACTTRSSVNPDGTYAVLGKANRCTFFSSRVTRKTMNGTPVTMRYFANRPSNGAAPKAVVLLLGGGNGVQSLAGPGGTGVAYNTGGSNFVIRTAQLLADAGYLTLAVDRPDDVFDTTRWTADEYRLSTRHAVDLLQVARYASSTLDLFIVGTSRAALSVVPQNLLASAVVISSPVTARGSSASPYFVDETQAEPTLRPSFVERPVHVMWHDADACTSITPASGSAALATALGASTTVISGGDQVTVPRNNVNPDPCGAYDHHGFFGREPEAVSATAAWLDGQVAALAAGGNRRPEVAFVTVPAAPGVPRRVDLSKLARDADGDTLTFTLAHPTSALGGTVTLDGHFATYTPPALTGVTSATDDFVWIATDGHGHVAAAVTSVKIGN